MIHTCRSLGVRVYADAVINHMSGGGNDANPHHRNPQAGCTKWPNKTSSLPGGSSPFYTQDFAYTVGAHTGKQPLQEFPAVPYGPLDFHCERALSSRTSSASASQASASMQPNTSSPKTWCRSSRSSDATWAVLSPATSSHGLRSCWEARRTC